MKYKLLIGDGQYHTKPKNMSKSSLLLSRFYNSRSYSQNNHPIKKETKATMSETMVVIVSVTIAVTTVAAHGGKVAPTYG